MDLKKLQDDLVPEPQNIKSSVRKVVLFILVVMVLAGVYQVVLNNYILPDREILWRRGNIDLVEEFDRQGRRLAVLVMLAPDLAEDDQQPVDVFKDPAVREEFNRLRLAPMLLAIDPTDQRQAEWLRERDFKQLPGLLLFVQGRSEALQLSADELQPRELARLLNDLRFDRYEP